MATFGNRPEDSVTDSRGNVRPGVVITVFASEADATANRSALGSKSAGEDGRWPIDIPGKTIVWAREPKGSVWPVTAAEATVADFTDQVNAAQAAAEAAQAAAESAATDAVAGAQSDLDTSTAAAQAAQAAAETAAQRAADAAAVFSPFSFDTDGVPYITDASTLIAYDTDGVPYITA